MNQMLFIDGDARGLEDLKERLKPMSELWEMSFASGAETALAMLEALPIDAAVTALRLHDGEARALLATMQKRWPKVVRVLSLLPEEVPRASDAISLAHQVLLRPAQADDVRVAIGRADGLRAVLSHEILAQIVGTMTDLPALPKTYRELSELMSDPEAPINKAVEIVEQDVGVSAKVLRLANSAIMGATRRITSIRMAVGYMGLTALRRLVLSAGAFELFPEKDRIKGFSFDGLYTHSQLTARIVSQFPAPQHSPDAPVVAALLHDIGKLVLATRLPYQFRRVLMMATEKNQPWHDVEREVMGISHAEIGAYLLDQWGLPCTVVEAVAHHHEPIRVPLQKFDALAAVYLANALAHEYPVLPARGNNVPHVPLDVSYAESLGLGAQIPAWRQAAQAAAAEIASQPSGA